MKTETLVIVGVLGVAAYLVYTVSFRTGQAIRAQERVPSRIIDAAENLGTGLLSYLNSAQSSPSGGMNTSSSPKLGATGDVKSGKSWFGK